MQTHRGTGLAKTSIDILHERNALLEASGAMRASLERIRREVSAATVRPELAYLTLCRIESLVEQALGEVHETEPVSGARVREGTRLDPCR